MITTLCPMKRGGRMPMFVHALVHKDRTGAGEVFYEVEILEITFAKGKKDMSHLVDLDKLTQQLVDES
jgi:hypothetical protein